MTQLTVVDRLGKEHQLESGSAHTLMEVLRDAGVNLAAICGGVLSCATCHVYAEHADQLPPPSEDEAAMTADLSHYRPGESRLSCQIVLADLAQPLRITVAPEE